MREQPAQRHLFAFGEAAVRQMPRLEQRVDVGVERESFVLDEPEKTAGEYRLADRAGEKERRASRPACVPPNSATP